MENSFPKLLSFSQVMHFLVSVFISSSLQVHPLHHIHIHTHTHTHTHTGILVVTWNQPPTDNKRQPYMSIYVQVLMYIYTLVCINGIQ